VTRLRWTRQFPASENKFDLILKNPDDLDPVQMRELLQAIKAETHRGLTLNRHAVSEFERWFQEPRTPLASGAYVHLSNWFMTSSGDRHSVVAACCEALWDALFPCRPTSRLSSPRQNYKMLPEAFERFWHRIEEAQGDRATNGEGKSAQLPRNGSMSLETLRATVEKEGLRCQVEGSAKAVAEFVQLVSKWSERA
jgi:hypothetical protein